MIERFDHPDLLPAEWDDLCGTNYALKRQFLSVMRKGNQSLQNYVLFRDVQGRANSILVLCFEKKSNVGMYTPIKINLPVTYVHLPLSVTRQGYVIGDSTRGEVELFLRKIPGLSIVVNWAPSDPIPNGFCTIQESAQITLPIRWKSIEQYLQSLRSHYRLRCRKALEKSQPLSFRFLDSPRNFTDEMYRMYLAVHDKSRIGIETLTIDYFRETSAIILAAYLCNQPIGFVQMIENPPELIFAFVGLDYQYSSQFDTYQSLLLQMVSYACEKGFTHLELGQTAEEAKLKLGGEYTPLYALLRHKNPVMNFGVRLMHSLLGWKEVPNIYTVFKEESHEPYTSSPSKS